MIDRLLAAFEWGHEDRCRNGWTSVSVVLISIACVVSVVVGLIVLPAAVGPTSNLVERPVPAGVWVMDWSPTVSAPSAEQQHQVRALRSVAAGTAGLIAILCLLVVTALWGQRLRLRRTEHFLHWAVGAGRRHASARLVGEFSFWIMVCPLGTILVVALLASTLERSFPGHAVVAVNVKAAAIVLTGIVVGLARWETRSATRFDRPPGLISRILSSPVTIATVGFCILSGVGLLVRNGPYAGSSFEPQGFVVRASLADLSEESRRRQIISLREALGAVEDGIGIASAGAARGVGRRDDVWTDCGHCSVGGLPLPIQTVRAEVRAGVQDTFAHLGIRLTDGRDFDDRIDNGALSVAIVSKALANRHFERGQAVGRRLRIGRGPWITVVGVVEDAPDVRRPFGYAVYVPLGQVAATEVEVLASRADTAARAAAELTRAGAHVSAFRTRAEVFAVHRWFRRLLASLGAIAMLVLVAGLWVSAGNEARAVRFEVGLRRAVGARPGELVRFFLGFIGGRVGFAVLVGAWLSLFLGAGLSEAYGAIPQIDWLVSVVAGACVALTYFIGSLVPFVGVGHAAVIECLNDAT